MGREFAQDGIDRNDYAVLTVIGFYGPITPTDLATKLGLPPTTLSTSIRRLGAHVARRPHPTGGRTAARSGRRSPRTASWSGSTRPPIRSSRR
ncbi:MAG: MarR family transcriptional regulator [Gaiellaceae bacterium]